MSTAFDSIKQGLDQAIEYAKNNKTGSKTHNVYVPDVKAIRNKIGMNQNEFATKIGISVSTLKYWEKGVRNPKGPSLVLLNIIDKAPKTIIEILSQ